MAARGDRLEEADHAGVRSLPTGHAPHSCAARCLHVVGFAANEPMCRSQWRAKMSGRGTLADRFRIWTLFCQSPRTALQYLLLCYLLFKVLQSDLPNRLHVHLCVLVWITQREGIPAACPSSMASSAEPTEADVAARSWAFDAAKSAAHAIVLNCLTLPRPRQSPLHAH